MSNYLAPATVTAVLRMKIQEAVDAAVPGAKVHLGPPTKSATTDPAAVYLYMYRVEPNAFLGNDHLPFRSGEGAFEHRPETALDLIYLMAFYGDEPLAADRMLGAVSAQMNAYPELTREQIERVVNDDRLYGGVLGDSDLQEQPDLVRFTPINLDLESLSKLWTVFMQVTHRISLVYRASPILIDTPVPTTPPLPVAASPQLSVAAAGIPTAHSIEPDVVDSGSDDAIRILGDHLMSPDLTLEVSGTPVTSEVVRGGRVIRRLPKDIPSGTNTISARRSVGPGKGEPLSVALGSIHVRPVLPTGGQYAQVPDPRSSASPRTTLETIQVELSPAGAASGFPSLLLNDGAGSGGYTLVSLLRFTIPGVLIDALEKRKVEPLVAAFATNGVVLPKRGPKLRKHRTTGGWTLTHGTGAGQCVFLLRKASYGIVVSYGLSAVGKLGRAAFRITTDAAAARAQPELYVAPGTYRIRLQAGPSGLDTSGLEPSGSTPLAQPTVTVP